jgi:hypothetical protein
MAIKRKIFKRKIFIGSSREALKTAELVREVVEKAGMAPLVWNTLFPPGVTLLEGIEKLPGDVDGAVLLWTPDLLCKRGDQESFNSPVANVVFEYGYLAASLTRSRVAICQFGRATIPSDLGGMLFVPAGDYKQGAALPLPEEAKMKLLGWLKRLPPMAGEVPATYRMHGYSGIWESKSQFSRWRDRPLGETDLVTFRGTTFLLLTADGQRGSGTQAGELSIRMDNYTAKYQVANRVERATIDAEGTLRLRCQVLSRVRTEEQGQPREAVFREELYGTPTFELTLKPASDEPKKLTGGHDYSPGAQPYQLATEDWTYLGF